MLLTRPTSLLLVCVVTAFTSGCGKNKSPGAPATGAASTAKTARPVLSAEPELLSVAPAEIGDANVFPEQISCGETNTANCPSAVGMLVMQSADGTYAQCSTFLVAPNVVITNSHCIPDDLKTNGSSCQNRGWLAFPALPSIPAEHVACAEVLTASPLPATGSPDVAQDFAVLRLANSLTDRTPLVISRDGFTDRQNVRITKVNPVTGGNPAGSLVSIGCKAIHGSSLVPHSADNLSNNMTFGDCTVVHGNSGSPILDQSGKVHGVIQFTFEADSAVNKATLQTLALFDGSLSALGGGTSFACLAFPAGVPAPPIPAACANRAMNDDPEKALDDKANALLNQKFTAAQSSLLPAYDWTAQESTESKPGGRAFLAVPDCVLNPGSVAATAHLNLPQFELITGMNSYYVIDFRVNDLAAVPATLSTEGMSVKMEDQSNALLFSKTLSPCGT